jgi:hypothetical protein
MPRPSLDETDTREVNEGDYYSFDVNDVHVTVYNSEFFVLKSIKEMEKYFTTEFIEMQQEKILQFLKEDLEANQDKNWRIVMMHTPLYAASPNNTYTLNYLHMLTKWKFDTIFAEYNVDLVLSGHEHDYERSLPLKNFDAGEFQNIYVDPGLPIYMICGTGGNEIPAGSYENFDNNMESLMNNWGWSRSLFSTVIAKVIGVCELEFEGDTASIKFKRLNRPGERPFQDVVGADFFQIKKTRFPQPFPPEEPGDNPPPDSPSEQPEVVDVNQEGFNAPEVVAGSTPVTQSTDGGVHEPQQTPKPKEPTGSTEVSGAQQGDLPEAQDSPSPQQGLPITDSINLPNLQQGNTPIPQTRDVEPLNTQQNRPTDVQNEVSKLVANTTPPDVQADRVNQNNLITDPQDRRQDPTPTPAGNVRTPNTSVQAQGKYINQLIDRFNKNQKRNKKRRMHKI